LPQSGNKCYLLRVDQRGQAFNHVSVSTPTLPRARIPSAVKQLFLLANFSSNMPDVIDTESTLTVKGQEILEKEFALDVQGLSKTYPKTVSGSDAKTNWKRMLGILTAKRQSQAKKSLDEFHALHDVSFNLRQGESLGIIGLNGSGKSTLLQIIAGTLEPTTGKVKTKGRIAALLELGSGFNPDFTGKENIYVNAAILGLSQSEIDAKYDEIVSFAAIGDFIHQPVRTYSSGMGLRLAFAVVAHVEPEILIIDEALAVGDARFQAKCFCFLESLQKQGKTLLFVSHDVNSVARLCSSAVLLHEGKVHAIGKPSDVINEYSKILVQGEPVAPTSEKPKPRQARTRQNSDPLEEVAPDLRKALLAEENAGESSHENEFAYGGKSGEIRNIQVQNGNGQETTVLISGELFSVRFAVHAHESIVEPIYAMTIRDSKGQQIYGQNTLFARVPTEDLKNGDEVEVVFRQTANMGIGDYLISLGLTRFEGEHLRVIHRRYDALEVKVLNTDGSFGIANCFSSIEWNAR
jgi:ABC-type polysaccharide/polyol phosphate transport system ATPase subunit